VATDPQAGAAWPLPRTLRRTLLLAPPLTLAVYEVFHPNPDENVQALMDASTWFMVFHLIQLPLVLLVALSVILLADTFGRASAWTTRAGVGLFLVFFSAYDTLAGVATGWAMRKARDLPAAGQEAVFDVVEEWPSLDPVAFPLSIVGTGGWLIALVALAIAAHRAGARWYQWVLIALAGIFLLGGHPFPAGTLAFGCLFVAALLRESRPHAAVTAADNQIAGAPPRSNPA
jgi:hypothetical protein